MPMSDTFSRVEIITGVARRRRFTTEQKLAVVSETMPLRTDAEKPRQGYVRTGSVVSSSTPFRVIGRNPVFGNEFGWNYLRRPW